MIIYEPYLDLPTRNKAAYDYANNNNWADKITGKLMLVAGTADSPRPGITMRFVSKLVEAGIDHELVVLPEAGHGYTGKDDEYFVHKLVWQFETYLKPLTH
jgi:dipeptidyl aminopeptidase/acylaminoacyl peptidase